MSLQLTALLYLVSSILFILALRGLSSPETSRKGNTYGMVGMGIAVLTTIANLGDLTGSIVWVLVALVIGGGVGTVLARRIQMTAMPQLVAAMHSLVGLAAVNIFGGFLVTQRMLAMYKKKEKK